MKPSLPSVAGRALHRPLFARLGLVLGLGLTATLSSGQPAPAATPPAAPGAAPARGGNGGEPAPMAYSNYEGWENLWDGASLKGWDGHPEVWFVKNVTEGGGRGQPAITYKVIAAEDSHEHAWPQGVGQTHLIYQGAPVKDFELKVEFRVRDNGNGGVQYRSYLFNDPARPQPYQVRGYQFDLDAQVRHTGQLYEGAGRGITALRGQVVQDLPGEQEGPRLIASVGDRTLLRGVMNAWPLWNQMHIIRRGDVSIHILNGQVLSIFIDDEPTKKRDEGIISVQLEGGSPKEVNYRNLYLKRLN